MIYILGRLFRYLWSAVSPCNEFCDRILSIPLLPRTIKLTAFILCLLLCVMKLIFSSQPFLLYSILKHKILFCLPYKNIYEFYGGRETSPEQVALVSFISIVLYSIYGHRCTITIVKVVTRRIKCGCNVGYFSTSSIAYYMEQKMCWKYTHDS